MESEPSAHVPAIYVAKYNRFVDNILGKINNILRANYEPVTVKLTNLNTNSKSNKNKSKAKRKGNKTGVKKSASRPIDAVTERSDKDNKVEKVTQITELITQATEKDPITLVAVESPTEASVRSSNRRTSNNKNSNKNNRKRTKNRTKVQNGSSGSSNKNKVRVESQDDHDRTREFVWKRSSHIAHLVSQKLSSATRSMLRPPPAAPAA